MSDSGEGVFWTGVVPTNCNICQRVLREEFVDGRMVERRGGRWAFMCLACHKHWGVGLGMGKGQRYRREEEGWRMVEG